MTLLEIKRVGSHFTAQRSLCTSAKRLAVRSLRVVVTLPERLVKSFYPTIPTSHAERAAATGSRSPAGPRRLGTATRISASLSRRLSAFFESTSRPRSQSGKVRRSDTRPGDVRKRAVRVEGSDSGPVRKAPVSPCEPLCAILLRKASVYPLSLVKANVGRLCEKLKSAMRSGLKQRCNGNFLAIFVEVDLGEKPNFTGRFSGR